MLFIVGLVIALIAVVIITRMRVPGGVYSANLGWMSEQWLRRTSRVAFTVGAPIAALVEESSRRYEMAFVFQRRLAIPLWAMAFFTVALTAPPPTTRFLMPATTLFVMTAVGIAAIVFSMSGAMPWLRTSRALARVRPSGDRDHVSAATTVAEATCVRTIEEPSRSGADDALDLVRMDDDGGWQMTRPPA